MRLYKKKQCFEMLKLLEEVHDKGDSMASLSGNCFVAEQWANACEEQA